MTLLGISESELMKENRITSLTACSTFIKYYLFLLMNNYNSNGICKGFEILCRKCKVLSLFLSQVPCHFFHRVIRSRH